MKAAEIRKKYLDFFAKRGHAVIPSAKLIPENDPTTLFTGSGMQPMIGYLLGAPHPLGKRIADSQKSFRSQDIEEVGDNRHTTFFEMLGNWSLGDYFKEEQIDFMWEFLTDEKSGLGLSPEKLYFSCFLGNVSLGVPKDEFSAKRWQEKYLALGLSAEIVDFQEKKEMDGERIFYYGEKKNWWSRAGEPENMPEGEPGGPDTEVFYDFGLERGLHEKSAWKDIPCHPNCDCGRFLEIGNNVFMEYRKEGGGFVKLSQKNVDFGGGLERLAAAKADEPDVFLIDLFSGARKFLEEISGLKYGEEEVTYAFRVILDHVRAATFLIGDGVLPGNKDQGYFVRRLIRRAVRFGRKINLTQKFLAGVAENFIAVYTEAYPDLLENKNQILLALREEEVRFGETLLAGLKEFEKISATRQISGGDSFLLFSTYGFPIEMTEELAKERGIVLDRESFEEELKKHQDVSRAGSLEKFKGGLKDTSEISVRYHTATHLLHQALRDILGEHVYQRGSNITPERLRFDFSHSQKMTDAEKQKVEDLVNQKIKLNLPITYRDISLSEAKKDGAIGLFEEKYGEMVRVYQIGERDQKYSLEFCGGPHVGQTGELGNFKILKEEAVAQGIRRIKAVLK